MSNKWDLTAAVEHPTKALAEFVAWTRFEDLPSQVVHEAKRMILDVIGCAMGGYVTDTGGVAVELTRYLGGNPQSTIIGSGEKTSCVNAAHANARMANALDADDTFLSVSHHGALTVCSALAIGEAHTISGKELITAVAVGFDIGARLGISIGPPLFDQKTKGAGGRMGGMPVTTFAAASAAAKALGLNPEQIANVFGIAAVEHRIGSQRKPQQSQAHSYKFGYAAETGITAALLAEYGLTADKEVLDGEYGAWKLSGAPQCNFELMVGRLSEKWYLLDTTYKAWPSLRWSHHPLTAFSRILKENQLSADKIEKVVVRTHVIGARPMFVEQNPQGMENCQFNHPHVIAMLALGITPGPYWYSPETLNDLRVREFRKRVTVEVQPGALEATAASNTDGQIRKLPASVEVTSGGKTYSAFTEYAKGDPWTKETYFTDEELKEKFRNMAKPLAVASESWQRKIEEIIEAIFGLEGIDNIGKLSRLLAP